MGPPQSQPEEKSAIAETVNAQRNSLEKMRGISADCTRTASVGVRLEISHHTEPGDEAGPVVELHDDLEDAGVDALGRLVRAEVLAAHPVADLHHVTGEPTV